MSQQQPPISDSAKIGYVQGVLLALKTLYRGGFGEKTLESIDTAYDYVCSLGITICLTEADKNAKKKMEAEEQG
jgi:hypothetical protein